MCLLFLYDLKRSELRLWPQKFHLFCDFDDLSQKIFLNDSNSINYGTTSALRVPTRPNTIPMRTGRNSWQKTEKTFIFIYLINTILITLYNTSCIDFKLFQKNFCLFLLLLHTTKTPNLVPAQFLLKIPWEHFFLCVNCLLTIVWKKLIIKRFYKCQKFSLKKWCARWFSRANVFHVIPAYSALYFAFALQFMCVLNGMEFKCTVFYRQIFLPCAFYNGI